MQALQSLSFLSNDSTAMDQLQDFLRRRVPRRRVKTLTTSSRSCTDSSWPLSVRH